MVPKRTNLFQEVVEIIHRHMAEGATVESSAMVPSRSTGEQREVDVVIRGTQAGYPVMISVEAVGRSRKADRTWVDQMLGKHADLPTSKLVLVSEKGFTKDARAAALAADAVPLAPETLSGHDVEEGVLGAVPSLWPKLVNFTVDDVSVNFAEPSPSDGWGDDPPLVCLDDGRLVGDLMQVASRFYHAEFLRLAGQMGLAGLKQNDVKPITVRMNPKEGPALQVPIEGVLRTLHLVNADGRGYALRRITLSGTAEITVSRIPLKQARLGEVNLTFRYGEGKVGDRDALVVLTEKDAGGGALSIRVRPIPGGTAT
jgi:hypothetical protein